MENLIGNGLLFRRVVYDLAKFKWTEIAIRVPFKKKKKKNDIFVIKVLHPIH